MWVPNVLICRANGGLLVAFACTFLMLVVFAGASLRSLSAQAPGDGQMYINDQTYAAGAAGEQFVVRASYAEFDCLGYSTGLGFDTAVLAVTGVTWRGALPEEPDFFEGRVEKGLLGYGCVIDFSFDASRVLPPSADQPLLVVTFDVLEQNDATTQIIFTDVPGDPKGTIENVLTDATGASRSPETVPATFTIERRFPVIDSFADNTGWEGKVFFVAGQFFGEGNLAVNVCQQPAMFTLLDDGQTLRVVAPPCGTLGPVTVEVCNTYGCASDAAGFTYVEPPPVITGFKQNSGFAGSQFIVEGENFDGPNLQVSVCARITAAELQPDGTLLVTAPDCPEVGPAGVEVCTDHGCDSDPGGFVYNPPPPRITGFQNNSGLAGTPFTIAGEHLDGPGLVVTVCSTVAQASLQPDGSLSVTAPECASIGPVEVQVCTDHGCDADRSGFTYDPPPPIISGFLNNAGLAGASFIIEGRHLDGPNRVVTVCSSIAAATLQPDGSLVVTAPDCGITGAVEVEVCTDYGCDSDPEGFTYLDNASPRILGYTGNSGRPGDTFLIHGANLEAPELRVSVCGAPAAAAITKTGSVHVTVPECGVIGPTAVEVCNMYGCDRDETGFTYDPPAPVITGFADNNGRPGQVFTIRGKNFGEPNLVVTVCDRTAGAALMADGSLRVTAPECATAGPVAVQVCTEHGCDSVADGFTYTYPPPVITALEDNNGRAGDVFTIFGKNLDAPDLVVRVCGQVSLASRSPDERSLQVTAPDCGTTGPVAVVICTAGGCDADEDGFTYLPPATPFIRSDSNCDGQTDIADPIFTLNHLFRSGTAEPCCMGAADANRDLVVDVSDPLFTLNHFFLGGSSPPPAPYPECGTLADVTDCDRHPCR